MARITVIGGTGYAGSNVVREAAARGHQVTSYSRKAPEQPVAGVDYKTGTVLDESVLVQAVADTDVVVSALSPRGDMEGQTSGVLAKVADLARNSGVRLGVIGARVLCWSHPTVRNWLKLMASPMRSSQKPPRWERSWKTCVQAVAAWNGSTLALWVGLGLGLPVKQPAPTALAGTSS